MSKRNALVQAAKSLLWEQGFEAMSPKKIMRLSGAGQGSLYHHFEGKQDLALIALAEVDAEMRAVVDEIFDREKDPMDRLHDYLNASRDELKGCKLGRLVGEKTVLESNICNIISKYFTTVCAYLKTALEDAKASGDLPPSLDAVAVSKSLQAVIQGGFILARAAGDPQEMRQAQEGAWMMIEGLSSR